MESWAKKPRLDPAKGEMVPENAVLLPLNGEWGNSCRLCLN
jgi:hypothetical protein